MFSSNHSFQDDEWDTLRRAVEGQQEVVYAIGLAPGTLLGRKLTRVIDGRAVGSIDPSLDKDVAEVGDRLLRTGGTKRRHVCRGEGVRRKYLSKRFDPHPPY